MNQCDPPLKNPGYAHEIKLITNVTLKIWDWLVSICPRYIINDQVLPLTWSP